MKTSRTVMGLLAAGFMLPIVPIMSIARGADSAQTVEGRIFRLLDRDAITVNFATGQSKLTENDKIALRVLVEKSGKNERFDRFVVAAWSDKEFPNKGVELSKFERDLADSREDSLRVALKAAGARDVDTYSFAEHPSWLGKVFNSENAQIKREAGAVKKPDDVVVADLGREIRKQGGPKAAVVILVEKSELAAH